MKTLKVFLIFILIMGAIGCNNANKDNENNVDDTLNLNDNADVNQFSPDNTALDPNATHRSMTKDDVSALYTDLQMTPEQIERFETENRSLRDSLGNINYGQNSEMDSSLKKVLTPGQYREYETWRDNRFKNRNNVDTNNDNTSQKP